MALKLMWRSKPTAQTFGQIFVVGVCRENSDVYWLKNVGNFEFSIYFS